MVKPCPLVRTVTQILARPLTHQEGLPKLPVPPLNQTCERYLAALEPLVSDEEMDHTRKVVQEFLKGGVGERLQKGLERRARKTDNWVDNWIYLTFMYQRRHDECKSSLLTEESVFCNYIH